MKKFNIAFQDFVLFPLDHTTFCFVFVYYQKNTRKNGNRNRKTLISSKRCTNCEKKMLYQRYYLFYSQSIDF